MANKNGNPELLREVPILRKRVSARFPGTFKGFLIRAKKDEMKALLSGRVKAGDLLRTLRRRDAMKHQPLMTVQELTNRIRNGPSRAGKAGMDLGSIRSDVRVINRMLDDVITHASEGGRALAQVAASDAARQAKQLFESLR